MSKKRPPKNPRRAPFLLVAIIMLVLVDMVFFGDERPYYDKLRQIGASEVVEQEESSEPITSTSYKAENYKKPVIDTEKQASGSFIDHEIDIAVRDVIFPNATPLWKKNAVKSRAPKDWPKVVIIIDDMGLDRKRSEKTAALKGPLTLAYLPYARDLPTQTKAARQKGHELMVHMPMQPMSDTLDTGPIALKEGQSKAEFETMLQKGLSAFDGFVGVNNHMGSRLTQDNRAMRLLMEHLYDRELLFVDSRTINTSVAADTAQRYGVAHAIRDVFLDHETSLEFARNALRNLEEVARRNGVAIAIGHPKDNTIQALQEWLPTLKNKQLALVPISAVVKTKWDDDKHTTAYQINAAHYHE